MKYLIVFSLFFSGTAMAWGERGHHTVGYVAALATNDALTSEEKKLLNGFFTERSIQLGHLNNIPDISWKERSKPNFFRWLNGPTHYLDVEALLGVPDKDYDEAYLAKVRDLEKDYKALLAKYEGKPSPLPGTESGKIKVYSEVGTAPWRTQELYDQMVKALRCSQEKAKLKATRKNKNFRSPFKLAKDGSALPYSCDPSTTREEHIYAAIVFAGVMGHFVGDLSQPYHCTADYNGWVTGHGGAHEYFETDVVLALGQNLTAQVTDAAASSHAKIWKAIGADPKDKHFAVQSMLNLAADSLKYYREAQKIDRDHIVIKEGDKIPWGGKPGRVKAQRKPIAEAKATSRYEKMIVNRLSTSAVVLGNLWVHAWRQAGRPDLSDMNLIAVAYPLDVPFLKPVYAPAKID